MKQGKSYRLSTMMRKLFTVPGVVADFTVGTVIVLTQMLLVERDVQRRLRLAGR